LAFPKELGIALDETVNLFASVWLDREQEARVLLTVLLLREINEPATKRFYTRTNVLGRAVLRANSTRNAIITVEVGDAKDDLRWGRLFNRDTPVVDGANYHCFHNWSLASWELEANRVINVHARNVRFNRLSLLHIIYNGSERLVMVVGNRFEFFGLNVLVSNRLLRVRHIVLLVRPGVFRLSSVFLREFDFRIRRRSERGIVASVVVVDVMVVRERHRRLVLNALAPRRSLRNELLRILLLRRAIKRYVFKSKVSRFGIGKYKVRPEIFERSSRVGFFFVALLLPYRRELVSQHKVVVEEGHFYK